MHYVLTSLQNVSENIRYIIGLNMILSVIFNELL